MITVKQAHRASSLLDELARQLRQHPLGPLDEELILVESRGLDRRLPLELTRRLGVTARLSLSMPASFIWERLLKPFAGAELPLYSPWEKQALGWRIMALLREDPSLAGPGAALVSGPDGLRAARELGQRLADLFDSYLVFRPGLLLAWQGLPHADLPGANQTAQAEQLAPWQRQLWRRLRSQNEVPTRAELMARWLLEATPELVADLPPRITLFNLRGLPPAQLQLVAHLSQWREVHVLLTNPSPQFYWSDLPTMRRRREPLDESQAPLLQANGRELGQWIDQLLEVGAVFSLLDDEAPDPNSSAYLTQLQGSLAQLGPMPVQELDSSLQFHSCHSHRRQAEVLHDALLDLLNRNPALGPGDVLVLCAEMESARPALEAVFSTQEEGRTLPWALSRAGDDHLTQAIAQVLELIEGRRLMDDVLAPLNCPILRHPLGLEAGELATLADWCRQVGIVWGRDAAHRVDLGLPETAEHSWRAGLDRLILGHAMEESEADESFLPSNATAGRHALLESLLAWHGKLEHMRRDVQRELDPAAWLHWLIAQLKGLGKAHDEGESRQLDGLRQRLLQLAQQCTAAGTCVSIPWSVARDFLRQALADDSQRISGLDGRLTIAPMLAGRGLPARVLVLFGLDEGVFPRPARRDELDLTLNLPLPGDRQPRDQDRGQFVDALCAAGEALLFFWNGMDSKEGNHRPPSVVTGELLDLIWRARPKPSQAHDKATAPPSDPVRKESLVQQHALEGFGARAFTNPAQPSFHQERHAMAHALLRARGRNLGTQGEHFWEANLELPAPPAELDLAALVAFYKNPAKAFLRRVGLRLPWDGAAPQRHEPFNLDHMTKGLLRRTIWEQRLAGGSARNDEARLRAGGLLPWGHIGSRQVKELQELVESALTLASQHGVRSPRPITLRCTLDGFSLPGVVWQDRGTLLLVSLSKTSSSQRMFHWIQHLWWHCADQLVEGDALPPLVDRRTLSLEFNGKGFKAEVLNRPGRPEEDLRVVVDHWRRGQAAWLPWLPCASEKLGQASFSWEGEAEGLLLSGDWFKGCEHLRDDPWLQLALQGADPFDHPQLSPIVLSLAQELSQLITSEGRSGRKDSSEGGPEA